MREDIILHHQAEINNLMPVSYYCCCLRLTYCIYFRIPHNFTRFIWFQKNKDLMTELVAGGKAKTNGKIIFYISTYSDVLINTSINRFWRSAYRRHCAFRRKQTSFVARWRLEPTTTVLSASSSIKRGCLG